MSMRRCGWNLGLATTLCLCWHQAAGAKETAAVAAYRSLVETTLCKHYFPPTGWELSDGTVQAKLLADGTLHDAQVIQPLHKPGQKPVHCVLGDEPLVYAIKESQPLPPPPAEVHCPVTLMAHFEPAPKGGCACRVDIQETDKPKDSKPQPPTPKRAVRKPR